MADIWIKPFAVAHPSPSLNYREKLSWKISEESWNQPGRLRLLLKIPLPRAFHGHDRVRGVVSLKPSKRQAGVRKFGFATIWPKEVNTDDVEIGIKLILRRGSVEVARYINQEFNVLKSDKSESVIVTKNRDYINPVVMSLFDGNGEFHVEAEISIFVKGQSSDRDSFGYVSAQSEFVADMSKLMSFEETSDVKVICNGKEFNCHRVILCGRSETFKRMLLGDTQEKATGKVAIKDSTVEAVDAMLRHIYTSELPSYEGQEETLHLLQLADMYQLDRLKFACADSIVARLTISNCISSFVTISRYFGSDPDSRVMQQVKKFMRCKKKQVINQSGWEEEFLKKYPDVALKITKTMIEGEDCHGCVNCAQ